MFEVLVQILFNETTTYSTVAVTAALPLRKSVQHKPQLLCSILRNLRRCRS